MKRRPAFPAAMDHSCSATGIAISVVAAVAMPFLRSRDQREMLVPLWHSIKSKPFVSPGCVGLLNFCVSFLDLPCRHDVRLRRGAKASGTWRMPGRRT